MFSKYKHILFITLVITILECTLFNAKCLTTLGTNQVNAFDLSITYNEHAEYDGSIIKVKRRDAQITIHNADVPVRTLYIKPVFKAFDTAGNIEIRYTDENLTHSYSAYLVNGYKSTWVIPIGAMGNVSQITLIFDDHHFDVEEIILNKPVPWTFHWLRWSVLILVCFFGYLAKKHNFVQIPYNENSAVQRLLLNTVLIGFICLCVFTAVSVSPPTTAVSMYNHMTDAIMLRQAHLNIEPDASLLSALEPYNPEYRITNNIKYELDLVYFNNKYYSYFGPVPALILHLPYRAVTGSHISDTAAVIFCAVFCVYGLYRLWFEIVRRYIKNTSFAFVFAGLVCVLFSSNLMLQVSRTDVYETAITCGLTLSVFGVFLLLRAIPDNERKRFSKRYLFGGALCLALAVGCRPTMLFASLTVPFIIFPGLYAAAKNEHSFSGKPNHGIAISNLTVLAFPYIIVGSLMMWFNYVRFGSVFEFGFAYQLTGLENVAVLADVGVTGLLRRGFDGLFSYLFTSYDLVPHFPFFIPQVSEAVFNGHMTRTPLIGVFALPITWFLVSVFALRKVTGEYRPLIAGMIISGLAIIVTTSSRVCIAGRYSSDFIWLFMFPSLICAHAVIKRASEYGEPEKKAALTTYMCAAALSALIACAWGFTGDSNFMYKNNPSVFRYIADAFCIF